jgi:NAD(P)H-nitrite reductase large subunit
MMIHGTTNASGVAEIKTNIRKYTTKGAPIGVSKVTVNQKLDLRGYEYTDAMAAWSQEQHVQFNQERQAVVDKIRTFPERLGNASETPLTVTIASGTGGTLTVDISDYKK